MEPLILLGVAVGVSKAIYDRRKGGARVLTATARTRRHSRHISNAVRSEVFLRDEGCCVDCGTTDDLQFDHVHPWSKGGPSTAENLQLLCGRCNRRKGARVPKPAHN
jgi:5-methylcytosine-specific restriction endonuclease McrA